MRNVLPIPSAWMMFKLPSPDVSDRAVAPTDLGREVGGLGVDVGVGEGGDDPVDRHPGHCRAENRQALDPAQGVDRGGQGRRRNRDGVLRGREAAEESIGSGVGARGKIERRRAEEESVQTVDRDGRAG